MAGPVWLLCVVATCLIVTTNPASAATVRRGFRETVIASGLENPTAMTVAPDGRIFVTQQRGEVRIIKDGILLPDPFVTVEVPLFDAGEQGLIGIALDPLFAINGFVYLHYTATTPDVHNRIIRLTAIGDTAAPDSEAVVLELPGLGSTSHNGGALHFGPDGFLYIGVGENSLRDEAQSLSSPLGKILRIAADGSIPETNPFYGVTTGINRAIWALGLRNPFTFAIEPGSGRMFINDVGEDDWEEINEGLAGANYGWPIAEGPNEEPSISSPLFAYSHDGGRCAIVGGAFYPLLSPQFPDEYAGDYFFADLCAGWIGHYDPATGMASIDFATRVGFPVDLALSPEGGLYYVERRRGLLVRIDYTGEDGPPAPDPVPPVIGPAPTVPDLVPPVIDQGPLSQIVTVGHAATFLVKASSAAPISYQWLRNDAVIPGATGSSYTLARVTMADNGARFNVRVWNADGQVTSTAAIVTVPVLVQKGRQKTSKSVPTPKLVRSRK